MRTIRWILILALFCGAASAQGSGPSTQNLYYVALEAALKQRAADHRFAHKDDTLSHVFVEKDIDLNDAFPSRIGSTDLTYVTLEELRARYEKIKKKIPYFKMRPIVNSGDRLIVNFTRYWYSFDGRTHFIELEGGYIVVFRYDCATHDYGIESAKLWGI